MPLRRWTSSSRSDDRNDPPSTPPARRSRRSNGSDTPVASSSRLTSSNHNGRKSNEVTPSPKRKGPPSTLGDLLSSSQSIRHAMPAKRIIELLDDSDSDTPDDTELRSRPAANVIDLDDIETPPLPPADDAALELPDSIEALPSASDTPPAEDSDDDAKFLDAVEVVLDPTPEPEPASPPKPPPPDPQSSQRPMFNTEELEMQPLYDELKALLETEQASDSEDDEESYEERRQRKLRANEALLAQLGLAASGGKPSDAPLPTVEEEQDGDAEEDEPIETQDTPARGRGRPKKRTRDEAMQASGDTPDAQSKKKKKYDRKIKFADDGTTKSAPPPGEAFVLGHVDLPSLRDRARNEYVFIRDVPDITPEDLATWSEDEEEEEDEVEILEDYDPFEDKVAKVRDSWGRVKTKRVNRQPDVLPDGTELSSCHQCRRKTADLKMRCQRMRQGVQCTMLYCKRCITIRYGIDFKLDDPNFYCPKCQGFCNCSVCLRRSGFGDLVSKGRKQLQVISSELRKLGGQRDLGSIHERIGEILAETADLDMDALISAQRKPKVPKVKAARKEKSDTNGTPRARGRPPKPKWRDEAQIEAILRSKGELSEELAEGEVFSPLEEDALGILAVARLVLKRVLSRQAAMPKPRLVVTLRRKPRTFDLFPASTRTSRIKQEEGKIPNYHDREKDVWVRGAADYSTSESEIDEIDELDELDDDDDDDDGNDDQQGEDGADELEDEEEAEGSADVEFEEGRTQVFASSSLYGQNHASGSNSRVSSPLTSIQGSLSSSSIASSVADQGKGLSHQSDAADDVQEMNGFSAQSSQLDIPQDMQQLALAVLENEEPRKALPPCIGGAFGS